MSDNRQQALEKLSAIRSAGEQLKPIGLLPPYLRELHESQQAHIRKTRIVDDGWDAAEAKAREEEQRR